MVVILLWVIMDQKAVEKECRMHGCQPAVSMAERIRAYLFCFLIPVVVGLLINYIK
jgi:hypothetical protein